MPDSYEPSVSWGLLVVDMQRYYLDEDSGFAQYHHHSEPGCLDYISQRCTQVVTPNILRLCEATRQLDRPVIYLRLCGQNDDRSDLHHTFQQAHHRGATAGFQNIYPIESDPFAAVIPEIAPIPGDSVLCKTTFSGFTTSELPTVISKLGLQRLIFTGLATSQCVETTARDAADRGLQVVHVEDAQADYSETVHRASLYSSQGVCGGFIMDTNNVLEAPWFH
jgi:nicotinamidase-related amidase